MFSSSCDVHVYDCQHVAAFMCMQTVHEFPVDGSGCVVFGIRREREEWFYVDIIVGNERRFEKVAYQKALAS